MERLVQLLVAFRRGVPEARGDALMDELNKGFDDHWTLCRKGPMIVEPR